MASRDDDALSWDGDDDPTLVGAAAPAVPVRVPQDAAAAPAADAGETPADPDDSAPATLSNAALVGVGVFGGIYLLLAIGWFIGGSRLQLIAQLFVDPAAHTAAWILATLAPVAWYATILLLTRARPSWLRFALLVVGAVVLVPWPFLMVGVGA
ncbi:DNA polymerase III subunit gamma/tau [Microbacterium sp. NPDC089189]|uniref:DNA polymerase III subunit gamma/tau n=1 Tax=Microbacterium sp. NPDC089189 TaxID=3154972 RepID=UPI003439D111